MPDIKSGSFECIGLSALEKKLEGLTDRIAKNVMAGAVRAGAVVVQKEARTNCPESAEAHWLGTKGSKGRALIQPGELKKKGIRVRKAKRGKYKEAITFEVYCSKRYWYWKFVEFGHVITAKRRNRREKRVAKEDWSGGHVPAKPFMRPAFEAMKEQAVEGVRVYAEKRIEKEAAKQG